MQTTTNSEADREVIGWRPLRHGVAHLWRRGYGAQVESACRIYTTADRLVAEGVDHRCSACIELAREAADHDAAEDEENECEGHESLAGEHMGESVYCNGTCRS